METTLFRHGDVLLLSRKDFKIPKTVKLKAGKLIHKGANNSHVISKGSAIFGKHDGKKVMRVKARSIVTHVGGSATHASKPIPPGDYWIEIQTFYDHMSEEAKQVVD
jgi:hypothetical protein